MRPSTRPRPGVQAADGQGGSGRPPRVDGEGRTHASRPTCERGQGEEEGARARRISPATSSRSRPTPRSPAAARSRRSARPTILPLAEFAERAYLDYAMSVVKGRALPERRGRPEAGAAAHPLRDARAGQPPRRAVKKSRAHRRRRARQVPSARRHRGVRRGGAHGAGLHAALSADRRPGQFRLARRRQRRRRCATPSAPHADSPSSAARRARPRHRRLHRQLRRRVPGAEAAAGAPADGAAQRRLGHRGGHGHRDPAAQPARSGGGLRAHARGRRRREAVVRGIRGPDFPGGGQIISAREEISAPTRRAAAACACAPAGRSRSSRAGSSASPSTELPPNTSAARVLADIEEITNPKPKAGKKSLTHGAGEPQGLGARAARKRPRRFRRRASGAPRVRAAHEPRGARRADGLPARPHLDGSQRGAQPGCDRPRRAPAPDGPRRGDRATGRTSASK